MSNVRSWPRSLASFILYGLTFGSSNLKIFTFVGYCYVLLFLFIFFLLSASLYIRGWDEGSRCTWLDVSSAVVYTSTYIFYVRDFIRLMVRGTFIVMALIRNGPIPRKSLVLKKIIILNYEWWTVNNTRCGRAKNGSFCEVFWLLIQLRVCTRTWDEVSVPGSLIHTCYLVGISKFLFRIENVE